jgi:anti-sigma28 factor (negative regulator of flagellin synthesis)
MSVLSQQNTESTVIAENTDISSNLNWGAGNKARGRITAPALRNIRSLPQVRKKKILEVRQQLAEGTYDIDKRLNAVLERLLEDLVA